MNNNNMNNTPTNVVPNNNVGQPTPVQPTVPTTPVAPVQPTTPTAPVAPVAPTPVVNQSVPQTPVNTPVQPVNGVQPSSSLEPEKKNNKVLYIVFGIVLVVVIACIVYFLLSEMNKKDDNDTKEPETNQNQENNNQTNNNKENENNQEPTQPTTTTNLSSWNGKYINGTMEIVIYQSAEDLVSVSISNNSGSGTVFDTEVESDTVISYEDEFFEDTDSVKIEKTATGIKVTSSSTDTESLLNSASGEYTKNSYTSYGWGGNYANGNVNVIISEIDQDYIMCTITKGYSVASFSFDSITETELKYEETLDGETVTVVKSDNGIQITASATETDSLFNEVSGTYTKN